MKLFSRLTALFLICCLSFTLIGGCAKQGDPVSTELPEIPNLDNTEDDFDLFERVINYCHAPDMGIPLGSPFGYLSDSSFAEAAMKRLDELEKAYNCVFSLKWETTSDIVKSVNAAAAAYQYIYDIVDVEDGLTADMGKAGSLVPWNEMADTIDIYDFQKWGAPNIYECVMLEGNIYGLRSALWPNRYPSFGVPIIFNGKLTAEGGYADPRELVEKKTWDREAMLQMIKDCTVIEGGTTVRYGMAVDTSYIYTLCVNGSGNSFYRYADGKCENTVKSDKIVEAITWVQNMFIENPECFVNAGKKGTRETFMNPFLEGNAALFMHMTWALFSIVAMQVEDWGLLPYPTGTEPEYGKWNSYYAGNRNYISIPITADDPDDLAFLIDKMYEPLEGYATEEEMKAFYLTSVFFDERDYDLYMDLCKNCRYMYHNWGGYNFSEYFVSNYAKVSAAEGIEKNMSTIDKLIEEYVAPNQAAYAEMEKLYQEKFAK